MTTPAIDRADKLPRQATPELNPEERVCGFSEVVERMSEPVAKAEASRCLVCGQCGNCRICLDLFGCPAFYVKGDRILIDPVLCSGCGVCVEICPNGAIRKLDETEVVQPDDPPVGPAEAFDEETK